MCNFTSLWVWATVTMITSTVHLRDRYSPPRRLREGLNSSKIKLNNCRIIQGLSLKANNIRKFFEKKNYLK